jgi:hypothetical protein
MSDMRLYLSRRGRLPLLVTFIVLLAMVVVAPSVGARAAVKQFTASISPGTATGNVSGSWTETVTNCGGPTLPPRCTVASTIGLGTIQIAVPTEFRPITSVTTSSPSGQTTRNWTASYDSGNGTINAFANGGTDKLPPGESILIRFSSTPTTCTAATKTFTTAAWGSTPSPGTDPFAIIGNQPTVNITGCALLDGGSITDPATGQTESVGGGFGGYLNVTFGGNLDCSTGDQGSQWSLYHLPTQVTITPGDGFTPGSGPKFSTSEFSAPAGNDSSWYLICYASDPSAITGTILHPCYPGFSAVLDTDAPSNPPPCVDKQYRDITTQKIVITIKVPPGDPLKH